MRYGEVLQMLITEIIREKRDGRELSDEAIVEFLQRYVADEVPDYQAAALLMAIFLQGMNPRELATWTDTMVRSGKVMDWSHLSANPVDKHSSGGVGDKISIPLAPLVAAAGATVPMMAGRGLGHTGGTLDKLEAIPGLRTRLSETEFRNTVEQFGFAIVGQTREIAPADRKLYALRDVTSTIESDPLIASSIMSKKIAEGVRGLVLDVKTGSGAFLADAERAKRVAAMMAGIGKAAGCTVHAFITQMGQPLGQAVGHANEIRESIEILRGEGPADVRELTLTLGADMLVLARIASDEQQARQKLLDVLESGAALERFAAVVTSQGGDRSYIDDPGKLEMSTEIHEVRAPRTGWLQYDDCRAIGEACLLLGGGRTRQDDEIDPGVGLEILAKTGDKLQADQPWCRIHARNRKGLEEAIERLKHAVSIHEDEVARMPLVLGKVRSDEV